MDCRGARRSGQQRWPAAARPCRLVAVMHIVITRDGRKGEAVSASIPENEAKLQKYLEDNLTSLPWSELEPDLDLFPIGREFRTRSGRGERTDLLAIDA